MKKTEVATKLFKEHYDCSQVLLLVFGDETGMDRDTALKLGSAFAGGMGKMGDTCGAVTGAFMVIGLIHGATDPGDKKAKAKTFSLTDAFVEKFNKLNTSTVCRELIECDIKEIGKLPVLRRREIHKKCLKSVQDAVEILEEIL